MDFVYNADSKKVIDGDIVSLETEEDLDREIKKTTKQVLEIQDTVEDQKKRLVLLKGKKDTNDLAGTVKINVQWLKDHERVLESLLTLKRDRFG